MIGPNEIVMEAGRLDDVEQSVFRDNNGGCIRPGRRSRSSLSLGLLRHDLTLSTISLYISSILAPARSFKTHGRKIRVISKNLLPTPTHDERTCHQPHLYCKLHTNQTQQLTHAHYPHHDVLVLLPLNQPPMSTTLLLTSLSRVERHRLQIAISQQIAMQTQEHRDITLPLP